MTFLTVPIDPAVVDYVRYTRTDPVYGHPYDVHTDTAGPNGYGPCRSCLRRFREGERRLLFLFNPFTSRFGDYAGPVFIHEEDCEPFDGEGFPQDLRELPLLLRAYDVRCAPEADATPDPQSIEAAVERLLADNRTGSLHVRNKEAKCYIARIVPERQRLADPPELDGMVGHATC